EDRVKFDGFGSCCESGCLGEVGEGGFVGSGGGAEFGGCGRAVKLGQASAREPVVGAGEEQGVAQAVVGDLISVGAGDAFDEPVGTQPPEVVGDLSAGHVPG